MSIFAVRLGFGAGNVRVNGMLRRVEVQVPATHENVFHAHAFSSAVFDRVALQVGAFSASSASLYLTPSMVTNTVLLLVSLLLFLGRPTTIVRRVVPVVVDAIKRCSFWARPHVGEEVRIGVPPAVAHGDASATVVAKVMVCWRVAAAKHSLPDAVVGRDCLEWHFQS